MLVDYESSSESIDEEKPEQPISTNQNLKVVTIGHQSLKEVKDLTGNFQTNPKNTLELKKIEDSIKNDSSRLKKRSLLNKEDYSECSSIEEDPEENLKNKIFDINQKQKLVKIDNSTKSAKLINSKKKCDFIPQQLRHKRANLPVEL